MLARGTKPANVLQRPAISSTLRPFCLPQISHSLAWDRTRLKLILIKYEDQYTPHRECSVLPLEGPIGAHCVEE